MTTGFATISGSVFAVYGSLDIPTSHLVGASVMSAPAALAISKVMCPEEQTPTPVDNWNMLSQASNVLEAIAQVCPPREMGKHFGEESFGKGGGGFLTMAPQYPH